MSDVEGEGGVAATTDIAAGAGEAQATQDAGLAASAGEEAKAPVAEPTKGDEKPAEQGTKPSDEGKAKPKEGEAVVPPGEEDTFAVPEGMQADEELLGEFKQVALAEKGSKQKLVDLYIKGVEKFSQGQQAQWEKTKKDWREQLEADTSIQDQDGKIEANLSLAKNAIEALGGKELQDALALLGADHNPHVVKAFIKVGKSMSEDRLVFGNTGGEQLSAADRLYPSMRKK